MHRDRLHEAQMPAAKAYSVENQTNARFPDRLISHAAHGGGIVTLPLIYDDRA